MCLENKIFDNIVDILPLNAAGEAYSKLLKNGCESPCFKSEEKPLYLPTIAGTPSDAQAKYCSMGSYAH